MSIADELSIQLYSLRDYKDLDAQLDALAEIGFRRVEAVGGHLSDAKATRAKLDARGLSAPTGHVGMDDLRSRADWVLEQARIVGIEQLFMPAVAAEDRVQPPDRWKAVGEELGKLAQTFAAAGIPLGYHNHHWELEPFDDGRTPLEILFDASRGSGLRWQADIAWLVRGGADPVVWLERYKDRLVSAHVKDIAPAGQNVDEDGWADIGKGTLDWPKLWREAKSRGAKWMVLEHDKPKDAVGFARSSRDYLIRTIG
jgi:sugar phosphate isomerase/epimerase